MVPEPGLLERADQPIPTTIAEMETRIANEPGVTRLAAAEAPAAQNPVTKVFSGTCGQVVPFSVARDFVGKEPTAALKFREHLLSQRAADPTLEADPHHTQVLEWCTALCLSNATGGPSTLLMNAAVTEKFLFGEQVKPILKVIKEHLGGWQPP